MLGLGSVGVVLYLSGDVDAAIGEVLLVQGVDVSRYVGRGYRDDASYAFFALVCPFVEWLYSHDPGRVGHFVGVALSRVLYNVGLYATGQYRYVFCL